MSNPDTTPTNGTGMAFAYVTTLFFAWGFATSLIDPLIAAVKGVFELSTFEAFLTQFAWFTAYGVFSLPAALALAKLGPAKAIVSALAVMVIGALIVPLSTMMDFYPGVLVALFVIGAGVTLLQVAANPLAAALGPAKQSHFRLVFSQTFNSLGAVVGPLLGATVMLSGGIFVAGGVTELGSLTTLIFLGLGVAGGAAVGWLVGTVRQDVKGWLLFGAAIGLALGWLTFLHRFVGASGVISAPDLTTAAAAAPPASPIDPALRAATLRNIDTIFLGLAVFFAVLCVFIWMIRSKLATVSTRVERAASPLKALGSPWAVFGAIAIFLYVGSEVAIGSIMTNFLHSTGALGLPIEDAGRLVALYWAGALMGRFAGSVLLTRLSAGWLLVFCTVVAGLFA